MDLLQILILLSVMGICGAFSVLILGFSPRGIMILLFSVISGVIGAALGTGLKGLLRLPDVFPIKVGSTRIDIIFTLIGSIIVVALLQVLLVGIERRTYRRTGEP